MKLLFFLLISFVAPAVSAQDPWKDVYRESAWEQRDTIGAETSGDSWAPEPGTARQRETNGTFARS